MDGILKSYNPANGELLGEIETTNTCKIYEILEDSKVAQKMWGELPINKRIELIEQAGKRIEGRLDEMALLLSKEMGKKLDRAKGEVMGCAYSGYTARIVADALKPVVTKGRGMTTEIQYNPIGVCGIITPWNYPVSMAHWMIIPALTAGNSVVLKPSEETPLVADMYVEILNQVLPKGVLQIVHGDKEQGKILTEAKQVSFIGFTGSRDAGKNIIRNSAATVKRLMLEMGGKDPMIVLRDANIDSAARFAVANSLENSGQMCISTEMILVDNCIYKKFIDKVIEYTSSYKVGPYNDFSSQVGPIINEKQRNKIIMHIEDAVKKGGKIVYGNQNHPEGYVNPTVIAGIKDDMIIAKEETFGPVICIKPFFEIEEAIESANSTDYGLGAIVFGNSDAEYVAEKLEAGMVGVNCGVGGMGDVPWVGAKQSGIGYHGSPDGHRQFTQVKVISRN